MSVRQSTTERSLYNQFRKAVLAFDLVRPHDRILVAISGGKDSHVMLYFLREMQRRQPFPFDLIAYHLDQAQPGYEGQSLADYLQREGYDHHIVQRDTYSIVKEKTQPGQAYCFLCSRLRRGILYDAARNLSCNKLALGHHREDALTTLLLNLVFTGQIKAMPASLLGDKGRCTVIRPLIYCPEADVATVASERRFPILPCNLCGSQDNLQRVAMRRLLEQIEAQNPGAKVRMLAALTHVRGGHLLDRELLGQLGLMQPPREGRVRPSLRVIPNGVDEEAGIEDAEIL